MSGQAVEIRDAADTDVAAIREIFNQVIVTTTAVWRDGPVDLSERRGWFTQRAGNGYPVIVAVLGGEVVGFASYGSFRVGSGYRFTVELTVHVRDGFRGRGIGRALVNELIERAAAAGMRTMVAGIDAETTGSIEFHRRLGFEEVGRMPEVGFKFERWIDLVLMQRRL